MGFLALLKPKIASVGQSDRKMNSVGQKKVILGFSPGNKAKMGFFVDFNKNRIYFFDLGLMRFN